MKGIVIGVLISIGIVLGLVLLVWYSARGVEDRPTRATTPEKLVKLSLPQDLPPLFTPESADADANVRYNKAFDFYSQNQEALKKDPVDPALADQLIDMFIDAMKAGQVRKPFLDDRIPLKPGGEPVDDAMDRVPTIIMKRGIDLYLEGKCARAVEAAHAIGALGVRAYQNSVRYSIRWFGLRMVASAEQGIAEWATPPAKSTDPSKPAPIKRYTPGPWDKAAEKIIKAWDSKAQAFMVMDGNVGDLLNVAYKDRDLTFRVEATLRLGVSKFRPGPSDLSRDFTRGNVKGNERAVRAAIADLKKDPEQLVKDAAVAADKFTREEFKKMR